MEPFGTLFITTIRRFERNYNESRWHIFLHPLHKDTTQTFLRDDHWLVRRSILAALVELECPEEILEVCVAGLEGEDAAVQEATLDALGALTTSRQAEAALSQLLALKNAETEYIRVRVAYALKHFDAERAKAALVQLRQDADHRVVGAAMENLML